MCLYAYGVAMVRSYCLLTDLGTVASFWCTKDFTPCHLGYPSSLARFMYISGEGRVSTVYAVARHRVRDLVVVVFLYYYLLTHQEAERMIDFPATAHPR